MSDENYKPFSERHGHKLPKSIQYETIDDDLRVGLWNVFYGEYSPNPDPLGNIKISITSVHEAIWVNFFNNPRDEYNYDKDNAIKLIKGIFLGSDRNKVFDIIEFIIKKSSYLLSDNYSNQQKTAFIDGCNKVLQKENSAYRICKELVTQITSKEEIESIETTMATPYQGASNHIKNALTFLSRRENPDYPNSIKESISAVESIIRQITSADFFANGVKEPLRLHLRCRWHSPRISERQTIRHRPKHRPLHAHHLLRLRQLHHRHQSTTRN